MKILLSGASGLVGSALLPLLNTHGHTTVQLVRRQPSENQLRWSPAEGQLDAAAVEQFDAVIHLGGESIAEGRWNEEKKRRIRDSRVNSTQLLSTTLAGLSAKPSVFVCASAIGYYGDRGDEVLFEESSPGSDFLANVCQQWEAATAAAADAGIRVANVRIGLVLSRSGGALAKMLLPFRLGGGGVLGSGKQYWSWITRTDLVRAIHHCLITDGLRGPVNGVAPQPVTNKEFTKALGRVLNRPTLVPLPAFAARLAFGEMADALMLGSTRVQPEKLGESGFAFQATDIIAGLREALAD